MFLTLFRGLWRRARFVHVFLCVHLCNPQAWSQDKLHVLMVADTADSEIGSTCAIDLEGMKKFFTNSEQIPSNKEVEITFMSGNPPPKVAPKALPFSRESVLEHYQAAAAGGKAAVSKVDPGDTVFFYYSGHGGFDSVKGHFMAQDGKLANALLRSELRAAIMNCKPRLAVIITDCCSNIIPLPPLTPVPPVIKALTLRNIPTGIINDLFFRPEGIVDVNACSQGQEAAGKERVGGFFTSVFIEQMKKGVVKTEAKLKNSHLPVKLDAKLTWREIFPLLTGPTSLKWKAEFPRPDCRDNEDLPDGKQCSQDPQAWCLPNSPDLDPPAPVKHGLTVDAGLIVRKVEAGSAAEKGGIKAGDVINSIDAKKVATVCEFDCAIAFASDPNKVTITFVRDAKSSDCVLKLDRAN
jgi:hypothetical protein